MISSQGYVLVRVPDDHHHRQANGYAYEHILVAEAKLGRRLGPGEIVHHINRDRQDNRPENLHVLSSTDHAKHHIHHDLARDAATGRFVGGRHHAAGGRLLAGCEWNEYPSNGQVWEQMPAVRTRQQVLGGMTL